MRKDGVEILTSCEPVSLSRKPNGKLELKMKCRTEETDCVIWAIGRVPSSSTLNLDQRSKS